MQKIFPSLKLCALLLLAVSQPASAMSVAAEPPCSPAILPLLPGAANFAQETRAERAKRILEHSRLPKKCFWENLKHDGRAEIGLKALKEIMLRDPQPSTRRHAAEAFGTSPFGAKAALAALATDIHMETDAWTIALRLESMGDQLMTLSSPDWDGSIDVVKLISGLRFSSVGRTDAELQSIRKAHAVMLARLTGTMGKVAACDDCVAKSSVTKGMWAAVVQELLRNLELAKSNDSSYAEWVEAPLNAFADTLAMHVVRLDASDQLALFIALHNMMQSGSEKLREDSIRVMSHLDASFLSTEAAAQLIAASASAALDPSEEMRVGAVTLLANLARTRGTTGDELVPALSDPSGQVRVTAARGLQGLAALPATARPGLIAMAGREEGESVVAMETLSREGSDRALGVLIEALNRTDYQARPDEPSLLRTAMREIAKFGGRAIPPLLQKSSTASDEQIQGHVYAALLQAGWPAVPTDAALVEKSLSPAIHGENEEARLFALSLLAMRPVDDTYRYPSALVDSLFRRYLRDKPVRMTARQANPRDIGISGRWSVTPVWNETWRTDPRLAASVLAGRSDSPFAAQRMVSWICSRHRMELAYVGTGLLTFDGSPVESEMKIAKAMTNSLGLMGEIAQPFIKRALREKKRTPLCRAYLSHVGA